MGWTKHKSFGSFTYLFVVFNLYQQQVFARKWSAIIWYFDSKGGIYFSATFLSLNHINLSINGGKSIFRELVLKTGAKLTSVEEAIRASQSNIVILAVPKDFYEKQPIHLLEGKVVIDVSNRNSIYAKGESQVFRTMVVFSY